MKAKIFVTLKNQVLDTAGVAVENSINKNLGLNQVKNVRIGKLIEFDIESENQDQASKVIDDICDKLLVNQVIEDYKFELK